MVDPFSLRIEDESGVEAASDILHDAVFPKDWIQFYAEDKKFMLRLWREDRDVRRESRVMWIFPKIEYLRRACSLTLLDVAAAEINVRDVLHYYSLFRLIYRSDNTLRLQTEGTMEIVLRVGELNGILVDTGETTWEQFGYLTIRLFPWT